MNNIIEKHINEVQRRFRKYNILILKSKYDKEISDELIQTYIEARYYNFGTDENIKFFYRRIYDALKKKGEKLIKKEPRKKELIENTISIFQYYFYFDFVRNTNDLDKIVNSIAEKRIFKFNLKTAVEDNEFQKELLALVKEDIKEVKRLLVSYTCKDFALNIKKFESFPNYYDVTLDYFFEIPELFSKEIVAEVYNASVVAEDKLFVEYPLITIEALKDILAGNFDKIYLCDFAASLFNKKNKINQVIQMLNNQATQDKIYFKVSYQNFIDYKENIYEMIRNGFKFALITNADMPRLSNEDLKLLEVFSCVVVDKKDVNKNKYKNVKLLQE